ncbi:hypothetical protein NDU88_001705 [Pleurodeles waltl]|uniref:Uncharacterized protein n=1 Tax=Pleurodeles waltl TaxID=8319 RepID=A0AAV7R7W5_PLEWA|nr:hypothetical protein NDU88_001705 [Pleurodeles waltl]
MGLCMSSAHPSAHPSSQRLAYIGAQLKEPREALLLRPDVPCSCTIDANTELCGCRSLFTSRVKRQGDLGIRHVSSGIGTGDCEICLCCSAARRRGCNNVRYTSLVYQALLSLRSLHFHSHTLRTLQPAGGSALGPY